MSDFDFTVTFEDDGMFATVEDVTANLGAWVESVVRPVVANDVGPDILQDAMTEPGAVKTPIRWTSPRQMRFVMMMKRKGLIASPYVRSHALSQGWYLSMDSISEDGLLIAMGNSAPHFRWVEGENQQGFHADTGWFYAPDKASGWADALVSAITLSLNEAWEGLNKT